MQALRLLGERQAKLVDQPRAEPGPGQVLIEMKAAGICGTDLHAYRASVEDYPPLAEFVPGHEPCGVVAQLGAGVTPWAVGDRVVVYHRLTCMRCAYCLSGSRNLCRDHRGVHGFGPDGADAEFMVTDALNLLVLPDDLTYADGVLLACQLGTAYSPLKRMDVNGLDTLVVCGLGGVGLFSVVLGAAMGARVVGVDPSPERRSLASSLGAQAVVDPVAEPAGAAIKALSPGGADKLIETSGSPAAHAELLGALRPRGRAAIVGLGAGRLSLELEELIADEIDVFGSSLFPFGDFGELVGLLRQPLPLRDVVTDQLAFHDAPAGFELADTARTGKVVFRFD